MFCPDCGKENPAGQKFCRSCGLSLSPISQALAGEVSPANANNNSTIVVQGKQSFWQNPFIYALLLIILGIVIGVAGDNVFHTKTVSDIGTLIALLGVGLLGFKGVMLVVRPQRYEPRANPSPQIETTSKLTPALLSEEPPSVTENTTRQLDESVEIQRSRPRTSTN
jgi:hypothetical protein